MVEHISFSRLLAISSMNLLGVLTIRIIYRYAFKCGNSTTISGKTLLILLKVFEGRIAGERSLDARDDKLEKLRVACETEDDDIVRDALRKVTSTLRKPEEVNKIANESEEMKNQRELVRQRVMLVHSGGY